MRQDAHIEKRLREIEARARAYDGASFDAASYPVLRRWQKTIEEDAGRARAECLKRLAADRTDLETLFGKLGRLRRLRAGLSDPHEKGRTVMELVFSSGKRLIYKPRAASHDAAYARLLSWAGWDFPVPLVLGRKSWSWHEALAPAPAKPTKRWLEDMGALLALLSLAGATDLHRENWLSKGGRPVPADLEGLFGYGGERRWAPLATGLLPVWRFAGEEALSEVDSGLFGALRPPSITRPAFRAGRLVYRLPKGPRPAPFDAKAVLRGFSRAARRLRSRRPPVPPGLKARTLARSTRDYADWLFWSTAPDLLKDERAQEGALDRFGFAPAERRALRRRDIPVSYAPAAAPRGAALDAAVCERALALASARLRPRGGSLLSWAVAIGEALGELAVETPRGPVWLDVARLRSPGRTMAYRPGDPSLYSGAAGVAVFLEELSLQSGRSEFSRLARRACRLDDVPGFVPAPRLGDADVLNGQAGACLWLLARGRRREAAALCASFAGKIPEGAGFGHGPAGTAVALWRLGREREARALLSVARERAKPGGWCCGDVGLALAEAEIEGASARPLPPLRRHHLCCGEAGRIAVLARLGRKREARQAGRDLAAFYRAKGAFRFQGLYERPFVPGLMGGLSGIGLALLAALEPRASWVLGASGGAPIGGLPDRNTCR